MAFTRRDGYPQKTVDKSGNKIIDCVYDTWANALLAHQTYAIGSECPDDSSLVLSSISITPNQGQSIGFVTLNYAASDAVVQVDSNQYEGGCQVSTSQEPISTHPSYRMNWDHCLIKLRGTAVAAPGDYATATKKTQTTEDWKWSRWDEPIDKDWETDAAYPATKPGIQYYLKPSPVITETRYYSSKKKLAQTLANVGTKTLPLDRYGLPATATNKYTGNPEGTFMLVGATVRREGNKYVVDMTYQFSDTGWDGDIYA